MKPSRRYSEFLTERLQSPQAALGYLDAALEEEDKEVFLLALRDVVQAHGGIGELARKTNLNRESLYTMLSSDGNPRMENLTRIAAVFGWRFALVEKDDSKKAA